MDLDDTDRASAYHPTIVADPFAAGSRADDLIGTAH